MGSAVDRGRRAFESQAWSEVHSQLLDADGDAPLGVEDLERLAIAAYLVGAEATSVDTWTRAHQERERLGESQRAARCAFWLAFALLNKGESARGGGWVDRARRLLADGDLDCVEQGYVQYLVGLRCVFEGDAAGGHAGFGQAGKIGDRFGDRDLRALARVGEGRCLIYLGEVAEGVALLDEAMVAVTAGEVSPIVAGDVYCTVIQGCWELFDVRRAQEWTAALSRWCDEQPDVVLYRGECLLHRAELMQLHGAWADAMQEVQRACDRLAQPPGQPAMGAATYARAELHRLRGELAPAEEAYRRASELGRDPQPGLALLRLAQGKLAAADATIRRSLPEAEDPSARAQLLGPYVEIVLAGGDVAAARLAADDLSGIAGELKAPFLQALAAHAAGAVLVAEGDPRRALVTLRRASAGWRDLDAPYLVARVRVLVALACRALRDDDGAGMELGAARSAFEQLGAVSDLAALERLAHGGAVPPPGGLTARERQVLILVATGRTNRAIAEELVVSEKTVASHLSHIFTKLGVASRAAATAYAYEHDLVKSSQQNY